MKNSDPLDPSPGRGVEPPRQLRHLFLLMALTAGVTAVVAIGVTALLVNIFQHKQEGKNPFFRVVDLTEETIEPEIWGKNFPLQYDAYSRTVDMVRTRFGGSEALPRTPTEADPRTVVTQSKLIEDPRLQRMWKGYAFAVDFREERGHAYMLEDQTFTGRQQAAAQPGACLNCHASMHTIYNKLGNGDAFKGFHAINGMPYAEAAQHATHPIACIDCHDPETLALRITRPAFMEGIKLVKAAEGIENYDVNKQATRQEMRSYVCAQCHVEYYFKGEGKTLTYPWHKGLKADEMLAYYDETGFRDWTHAETGAAMLKAQHPEFEMWRQGTHSRAGVSCADCHMPYQRVGALKISDHHVRSPLLNINKACQTCHNVPEQELLDRAHTIQTRHYELRDLALSSLLDLIDGIKEAMESGATEEELAAPRDFQRKATFLLDFAEAENSTGFHAPQEGARVLALSLDHSRRGWMALSEIWKRRGAAAPPAVTALESRLETEGTPDPDAAESANAPPKTNSTPDGA